MKTSLAAIALTVLGIPLIWTGTNPLYAMGWVAFVVGIVAGIAGAVIAVVSRQMETWKRVAAFVLGAAPLGFTVFAVYAIANMPYD